MSNEYDNQPVGFENKVIEGFNILFRKLNTISAQLDTLIKQTAPAPPDLDDPKEAARRWFERHFNPDFEGEANDYLDYMSSYEHPRSREDAAGYIADMCDIGLLPAEDACTTECARHAMALMKISGKCSPDYLRRGISAAIRQLDGEEEAGV